MKGILFDRRSAMLGLAGLMAGSSALADGEVSPIAHGALANNKLAQSFQKATHDLPDVTLIGSDGECSIGAFKGRTILMPLWAEWCAPCLSEIPDFARLQQKYGNDKFAVIPVLTGTKRQMTVPAIAQVFQILHAAALKPQMEKNCGDKLMRTMARQNNGYAIPCNLLIAPDGTVVAREIGRETAPDASEGTAPEKTKDAETVTRAIHGQAQSLWGKAEGEEIAAAMAKGFLG
jgi:thiol-disulfide isomerase/thioredoxin